MVSVVDKDIVKFYEDGKDRRYKLLFAVQGGAFAIAKLMGDTKNPLELGSLDSFYLAIGMALFTTAMVIDIDAFGLKMRRKDKKLEEPFGLFGLAGVFVLGCLGLILVLGWTLTAIPDSACDRDDRWPTWLILIISGVSYFVIVALYHWLIDDLLRKWSKDNS